MIEITASEIVNVKKPNNEKMSLWDSWKQPPKDVLKPYKASGFSGTDIDPMWRIKVLTEKFGACGVGWYYTIDKQWSEQGFNKVLMCFSNVSLFLKIAGGWSAPIQGSGGNEIIHDFKQAGPANSDEGYKMSVTDALSVSCKMLGIGADIYMGKFDGSKYKDDAPQNKPQQNIAIKKGEIKDGELLFSLQKNIGLMYRELKMPLSDDGKEVINLAIDNGIIEGPKSAITLTLEECKQIINVLQGIKEARTK